MLKWFGRDASGAGISGWILRDDVLYGVYANDRAGIYHEGRMLKGATTLDFDIVIRDGLYRQSRLPNRMTDISESGLVGVKPKDLR